MFPPREVSGCVCCGVNRRRFLAGCAGCAGAMLIPMAGDVVAAVEAKKKRVRVIYSLYADVEPGPEWPHVGFDFSPVMREMNAALEAGCPEIEWLVGKANGPDQAKTILDADKNGNIDGYLVMQMNLWTTVAPTMVASGKPVLLGDYTYGGSGGVLCTSAAMLREKKPNFGFMSSSRFDDVVEAAKCFLTVGKPHEFAEAVARVRRARTKTPGGMDCKPDRLTLASPSEWKEKMKKSKILTVGGEGWGGPKPVMNELGCTVQEIPYAELNDAWKAADKDQAKQWADTWQKRATRIAEVTRETFESSAAMYLGIKSILAKHGADAITINCLGGFYGGHIHAYPCLGFHELCNEGLVGACECDLTSAATMVSLRNLTGGRTGFISDPVIDTAKRNIIYAHCVASNRALGPAGPENPIEILTHPAGPENPIEILTHSEDRKGAVVRSIMPAGYMTTTLELAASRKELLIHRGKTVGNDSNDRACRTKLVVEPDGDIEKLFTQWDRFGWHRVTVYGDVKEPLLEIAKMLKWTITEEA
jgi:hypothetical protein